MKKVLIITLRILLSACKKDIDNYTAIFDQITVPKEVETIMNP